MRKNILIKWLNFTLTVLLLNILSGCSVLDQFSVASDSDEPQAEIDYDQINQYVKEWEEAKPKVERLSDLEHDLALIIKEVGKLSSLKSAPPQFADQQLTDFIEAEYEDDDATDSATNIAESSPDETNMESDRQVYAAHLALFLQEDSARAGWNVLKMRYPKVLRGLTPVVKKVTRNQMAIYSLRVGPFEKQDSADLVCNIFSRYKYKCETTDFSGKAI